MYHLVILRKVCATNSRPLMSVAYHLERRHCSLCNRLNNIKEQSDIVVIQDQARYQSSYNLVALLSKRPSKKKKYRNKKKYAELLEVSDGATNERKTVVSKLKSKDLTSLVNQPVISSVRVKNQGKNVKTSSVLFSGHCTSKDEQSTGKDVNETKQDNMNWKDSGKSNVISQTVDVECLDCREENSTLFDELTFDYTHSHNNSLHLNSSEVVADPEARDEFFQNDTLIEEFDNVSHEKSIDISDNICDAGIIEDDYTVAGDVYDAMKSVMPPTKLTKNVERDKKYILRSGIKEQTAKRKHSDIVKQGRAESAVKNFNSFLELCINSGHLDKAFLSLKFYAHWKVSKKKLAQCCSIILHGYAEKGQMKKIKEVLNFMDKEKTCLNYQCYAAVLECIGRIHSDMDSSKILQRIQEEMQQKNISFEDIMKHSLFVSDQRETVLTAIRRIYPDFEYVSPLPNMKYCCQLLKDLNTLSSRKTESPICGVMDHSKLKDFVRKQFDQESKFFLEVKTVEKRSEPEEIISKHREKLDELLIGWEKIIRKSLTRDLENLHLQLHSAFSFRHLNIYPFLVVLDNQHYVDIILREIRLLAQGSETFSPTLHQLCRGLGNQVYLRYILEYKQKAGIMEKLDKLLMDYCDWFAKPTGAFKNSREKWQNLINANQDGPDVILPERAWSSTVITEVGKFLYNIILRDIKIDVNVVKYSQTCEKTPRLLPAFYTLFRNQGYLYKQEIKPHPLLVRLYKGSALDNLIFEVTTVPMLCPPLPWTDINSGGYLVSKTKFMRLPFQAHQQLERLENAPRQQLYPAFDTLNQLGSVPWKVNEQILDLVIEVFNSGGSKKLDIPEPSSACPSPGVITPEMTKKERYQIFRQRLAMKRKKAEMYSLWCDTLYKLSLANHFRKDIFWLPHNMDFRGRVYPCPPHLSHIGSDMARALLSFAKGKPLGPNGLDWLKIHAINLTGLKKRESISARLQYANEILPDIIDSAKYPLTGRMWWAASEEPWQTLACCMEICNAIDSGNLSSYISHFPVHQDGSCNGLQHYAALGRDKAGAESVNLSPSNTPQDVYSCVAALVERERQKDANSGNKVAQILDGFIARKVIKQTVMTTVYGVTRYGSRLQIARQLKDLDNFPKEYIWSASTYLVGKTFESLQEMFTSAKEIQDWFTDCARLISQICGENVEWVTPLGLPIVQPYSRTKAIMNNHNSRKLQEHFIMDSYDRPNVMKQKNAFPPNFIHSLDSSHMMLTSLFCEQKDLTFMSVHDCFWTHACSVSELNKICREQFVALHSEPILENLSEFLLKRYSYSEREISSDGSMVNASKRHLNRVLKEVPSKGNFQLESVLDSVYFFS